MFCNLSSELLLIIENLICSTKIVEPLTRGGIGYSGMKTIRFNLIDTNTLTENLGERVNPSNLERVEAVKIVYKKLNEENVREEILYFMKDGNVKSFTLQQLLLKTVRELKYIHYLLRVEDKVTRNWSFMILDVIKRRVMTKDNYYNGDYVSVYRTYFGQDRQMQKGAAEIKVFLNNPQLSFSPDHEDTNLTFLMIGDLELKISSISKLRSAIYQLGEDTEEKSELKKKLTEVLKSKEEEMLNNFLERKISYLRILD